MGRLAPLTAASTLLTNFERRTYMYSGQALGNVMLNKMFVGLNRCSAMDESMAICINSD